MENQSILRGSSATRIGASATSRSTKASVGRQYSSLG